MDRTEKEKMLAGELYDASDPELTRERLTARKLTRELSLPESLDRAAYKNIISQLLPNAGEDIEIDAPFFCDYGYNIYTGHRVFFNFNCVVLDVMPVRIGNRVLFGPGVHIYTATHPVDAIERAAGPEYAKSIIIGDDCWIGGGAIICPGVTIGERCVIGAGAVVTKNIAPGRVVAGNPAKILEKYKA